MDYEIKIHTLIYCNDILVGCTYGIFIEGLNYNDEIYFDSSGKGSMSDEEFSRLKINIDEIMTKFFKQKIALNHIQVEQVYLTQED